MSFQFFTNLKEKTYLKILSITKRIFYYPVIIYNIYRKSERY